MRYNLTQKQWNLLWDLNESQWNLCNNCLSDVVNPNDVELNNRIDLFKIMFPNLQYNELSLQHDITTDNGFWGYVEGNEKDITLFLLKL